MSFGQKIAPAGEVRVLTVGIGFAAYCELDDDVAILVHDISTQQLC